MRRLEWLLQIWFMWHLIKIIPAQSENEMNTKENTFSVLRYPAVTGDGNRDFIKYFPKICSDDNRVNDGDGDDDADSDDGDGETTHVFKPASEKVQAFELLNIYQNILQQIQKSNCRKTKSFLITTTTTTMPQAETVAPSEPNVLQSQQELQVRQNRAGLEAFSILEQLKFDEMEAMHEQQQQTQKQQKKQQQQKLLQIQQMKNMQQILETLKAQQNLAKATKKKKNKKKKNKKKKITKPKKKKKKVKKPSKNKKRKKKTTKPAAPLLTQPAHILFASATPSPIATSTTKKPHKHKVVPVKKIKYILRKNSIFKKKKKEYLNHVKHVAYPFVKFIAFFTILNPFTLAVFLFSLISPVVFGFLGFMGLSFLIKPALHLLFGVKRTVNSINRQKWLQHRNRERQRLSRRPITVHKHYYEQRPLAAPPPKSKGSHRYPQTNQHHHHQHSKHFNPIHKLEKDSFEMF